MKIHSFYDEDTFTLTYVVWDASTKDAVVIDPVLDYDPSSSKISTRSAQRLFEFLATEKLTLRASLETHAHADHLSAGQVLKRHFGVPVGIGHRISEVQQVFRDVFDLPEVFPVDGSQFDLRFRDGDRYLAGSLAVTVLATPGHTPACVSYRIGDAVFTGDALFIEDYGTGRCDFPAGSAKALYRSVHDVLYALPDETRVFVGHDYLPGGRALRAETTIGVSKRENLQLRATTEEATFVAFREARDGTLAPPRLLYPSVQINIDAGNLPAPTPSGARYLKLPLRGSLETRE